MATRKAAASRSSRALLAVDVGNSETVIGRFRGAVLQDFWRVTSGRATADELTLTLAQLLGSPRVRGAGGVVCSVVPGLTAAWAEALRRVTAAAPVEIGVRRPALPLEVPDPASVGADRIANAMGAIARHGAPAIVVDLGTATTFDCVSRAGAYVGGAIAPGIVTSSEELFRRAARLARVEFRRPERALGRTTEECLRVGVIWGYAGLVDGLVRRLAKEMVGKPKVIATGGLARVLSAECETITAIDEELTLHGMRLLWEEQS